MESLTSAEWCLFATSEWMKNRGHETFLKMLNVTTKYAFFRNYAPCGDKRSIFF